MLKLKAIKPSKMAVQEGASRNAFAKLLQATQVEVSKPTFVEVKRGGLKGKRRAYSSSKDETGSEDSAPTNLGGSATNLKSRSWGRRKAPKKEVDERLGCTLFVGNLPLSMTRKRLKALFCTHGTVESVRIRSVVGERVGGSKRPLLDKATRFNAYVVFTDASAAEAALELNGHVIDGQHLRVDMAGNSRQHSHGQSVFVGNIPHEVTEEEFHAAFTEFGEIEGVRLVRDKATGLCKGFGFVLFKDAAAVLLATKFKGIKLKDRQLRVFRSRPMTNRHQPLQHSSLPRFAGEVADGQKRQRKQFQGKKGVGQDGVKKWIGAKRRAYGDGAKASKPAPGGHKFQKKKVKKLKHAGRKAKRAKDQ